MLRIRIQDPMPFWPRDPWWVKNQDPEPGSGMNILDHISKSSETIFGVKKILKFFYADPDLFCPGSRIRKTELKSTCIVCVKWERNNLIPVPGTVSFCCADLWLFITAGSLWAPWSQWNRKKLRPRPPRKRNWRRGSCQSTPGPLPPRLSSSYPP